MSEQPYITGTEVATASGDYQSLLADQVEVGRLRPTSGDMETPGEWTLSSAGPVTFPDVSFLADDEERAIGEAKAWLAKFFEEYPGQIP